MLLRKGWYQPNDHTENSKRVTGDINVCVYIYIYIYIYRERERERERESLLKDCYNLHLICDIALHVTREYKTLFAFEIRCPVF